jgi:catalase
VHARGSAAHGYFENFKSLADITKADLFQRPGEKTPLFTRISTVAGGAGSVDTPRDVRGFAVKARAFPARTTVVTGNDI